VSQEPQRPPHRDAVAETARWTAAARAQESEREDRLFDDPLARDLAGAAGFEMLARFDQHGDGNPYLPIRTRWYDDVLTAAVDEGRRQVVMLAAGLDTRAYRLAWPPQTVLLEVDQPRLLADKQMVLDAAGARPRCDRRAVSADLGGDWTAPLEQAGYQGDDPAVFTAEGVLFYLTESAARTVLMTAAEAAAPGSRLAVDLVNGGFFRFPYTRDYLEALVAAGIPWRFGTDTPEQLLTECGWRVDSIDEPGSENASYGRWPYPPSTTDIPDLPRSFLLTATRPD
jgi:methyltransferase (TIGR00027 family)